MSKRDYPSLSPYPHMAEAGFEDYIDAARDVLPDDWGERYVHSPRVLAYGLTYYVACDEYTQAAVADRFGIDDASLRRAFSTLVDDLGPPGSESDV